MQSEATWAIHPISDANYEELVAAKYPEVPLAEAVAAAQEAGAPVTLRQPPPATIVRVPGVVFQQIIRAARHKAALETALARAAAARHTKRDRAQATRKKQRRGRR